jgi:micrococcal nuclease
MTGPGADPLYRVNILGLKSYKNAEIGKMMPAFVTSVVDGDTIKIALGGGSGPAVNETIRLIGVDTPETVAPRRPVERFGKEASEYTRSRLEGKQVLLAFDWDLRDKYGRLLAYVYLPDGSCLNADIVAGGYGHAYTRFPFQFSQEFRRLETAARTAKKGLWKSS